MMRVLIAGHGKMGSWLSALLGRSHKCAVYETNSIIRDHHPHILFLNTPGQISEYQPDILINCVDLRNTIPLFVELSQSLPEDCILSDITSVKDGLQQYYSTCKHRFVSVHPMFGPTFTDMSNPAGRTAYIMSESDSFGKSLFNEIFTGEGIRVTECTFDEHDRLMAKMLSVPVLQAILFAATGVVDPDKGSTYDRFHTLSGMVLCESPGLLNSLLANPYTLDVITKMGETLTTAKDLILSGRQIDTKELLINLGAKGKG